MSSTAGNVLLVVDRMPLRRAQLATFLDIWAGANCLSIGACDISELIGQRQVPRIGLAVLSIGSEDLTEPNLAGALRVLRSLDLGTPIVVMSESAQTSDIECALALGAAGYIPASLDARVALAALSFILAGGTYFPTSAVKQREGPAIEPPLPRIRLSPTGNGRSDAKREHSGKTIGETAEIPSSNHDSDDEMQPAEPQAAADLTARQVQVLGCLRMGHSNKQIARDLEMSEATVKVHVRQVMKRLGAANRTHAAVLAMGTVTNLAAAPAEVLPSVVPSAASPALADPTVPKLSVAKWNATVATARRHAS